MNAMTDWFKKLSLDEKEQVLVDLEEIVRQEKSAKIRELRAELDRLKSGKKKKPSSAPEIVAKYCDPRDPTRTWAGRGGKPRWVREHEKAGGSLNDLRAAVVGGA